MISYDKLCAIDIIKCGAVSHFHLAFLAETHQGVNFEDDAEQILAEKLKGFYGSLRMVNGERYSRSGMINMRSGINRHLTNPPHNRQLNIMRDRVFMSANQVKIKESYKNTI